MSFARKAPSWAIIAFISLFSAFLLGSVTQAHAEYIPSREDSLVYAQSYSAGTGAYPEAVAVSPFGGYFMSASDYNGPGGGDEFNYVLGYNLAQQQTFSYGSEGPFMLMYPSSIDFTSDGKVVVCDAGHDRIVVVDAITGEYVTELGNSDPENPGLLFPGGVAVAPDDTVWVADSWNSEVDHYALDGTLLGSFHVDGWVDGYPSPQPESIEIDGSGNLWMAFPYENYVQCYDPSGNLLKTISSWDVLDAQGAPVGTDELAGPRDVDVDPWGMLWIADTSNVRRLVRLQPDGEWLGTYSPSLVLDGLSEIDVDANGNVWAADQVGDAIRRFNLVKPGLEHIPVTTSDAPLGWQTEDLTVTLTVTDEGDDVDKTYYSLDGSDPSIEYTGPFVVSADGTTTITYRSVDLAGSWEPPSMAVVRVDHSGPAGAIAVPDLTMATSVDVSLAASDSVSGLASLAYSLDGGPTTTYEDPITVTEYADHVVDLYATDVAGNATHLTKNFTLEPPDTVAPVSSSDISGIWVNHPVTVTLDATDDRSGIDEIRYGVAGASPVTLYGAPFVVSAEGVTEVSYYALDGSGNAEAPHSDFVRIDTVDPVSLATVPPSSWTTAKLGFSADDERSGLDEISYRIDGGTWNPVADGATVDYSVAGSHVLEYFATDVAGNAETVKSVAFEVKNDTTAPTTTSNAVATYLDSASIALTANDDAGGSGVDWTRWRLDGGPWNTGTVATTALNGTHLLEWQSQDSLGNLETLKSASFTVMTRYDQSAPGVYLKGTWHTSSGTNLYGGNYRYATSAGSVAYVTFTGTRIDWVTAVNTGYGKAWVTLDGAAPVEVDLYAPVIAYKQRVWSSGDLVNGSHRLKIEFAGTKNAASSGYAVGVDAFDVAGTGLNVDTVSPSTSAQTSSAWTGSAQTVTLSASDAATWVNATYYRLDGGAATTYTAPVALTSESSTMEYWSVDGAGNVETAAEVLNRVDLTAPVVTDDAPTQWVKDGATVTLGADDARSGVAHIDYSIDGGPESGYTSPLSIATEGVHTLTYRATDAVGNVSAPVQRTVMIDRSAPVVTHDAPATWANTPVLVSLAANDALSGEGSLEAAADGAPLSPYTSPIAFVTEGMHELAYASSDAVGNATGVLTHTFGLDYAAPVSAASVNPVYASSAVIDISAVDALSGVATTQWRIDGGAWTNGASATITQPGQHVFEYRSVDAAGNVEEPKSASFSIAWRAEQDAAGIYYQGTWVYAPSASRSAGGWVYAYNAGAKAVLRFSGSQFTLIGSKAPNYGIAKVTVDGVEYAADFYQATSTNKLPVLSVTGLADTTHHMTIEWTGTKNAASTDTRIGLDALDLTGAIVADTTPPTVTGDADSAWRATDATITLGGADAHSAVGAIKYRVDAGVTATYTAPFKVGLEGAHSVEYWSVDLAGNASAPSSLTVRRDSTAPVTSSDAVAAYPATATVTLSPSDTHSAVSATQWRDNAGAWNSGTTAVIGKLGSHVLEFRSTDALGNVETTRSATFTVGTRAEDTDTHIAYEGTWTKAPGAARSAGSWAYTNTSGSRAVFTFTGTAFDLIGSTAPTYGRAVVTVDGTATRTVDFYTANYLNQQRLLSVDGLSNGTHVVAVAWTGTKDPASTGTAIGLDAIEHNGSLSSTVIRYEETDARLTWHGTWASGPSTKRSAGAWNYTNTAESCMNMSFTGTGFKLFGSTAPTYGIMRVTVDGGAPRLVDLYTSGYLHNFQVLDVSGLEYGTHTVGIEWTGTKNAASSNTGIGFDAAEITGGISQAAPAGPQLTRSEQTDSKIVYDGAWSSAPSPLRSAGSWTYANHAGSAAYVWFTGTRFDLIGSTAPSYGIARVTIDGTQQYSADFYTSASLHNRRVLSVTGLAAGPHTVAIEWTGTKNPAATGTFVGIDAIDTDGALSQASLPGYPVIRYEETDEHVTYEGSWADYAGATRSAGSWRYANATGSAAEFSFSGTRVELRVSKAPTYGIATVYLDGTPYLMDLYSAAYLNNQLGWSSGTIADGTHTVRVEWSGTKNAGSTATGIGIDAIDVKGTIQ